MTKEEFKPQYKRLVEIYGEKSKAHTAEWFIHFGKVDLDMFNEWVTLVISEFEPFGQDRWPTPGQFRRIVRASQEVPVKFIDNQAIVKLVEKKRADWREEK